MILILLTEKERYMNIVDMGQLIQTGKTAKVYLYNGFAYKVYHPGYPDKLIEDEIDKQNQVFDMKLPVVRY